MTLFAAILALALAGQSPAPTAPATPLTCSAGLKVCEAARTQLDLKLQDEMERADVQNYLLRAELGATKQKLAAALKKCGEACAPPAPAGAAAPAR